jgi:hypothetical protein
MKILIPFLVIAFAATITFAQEESASPAAEATASASDEKASATVEETPAAKAAKAAESVAPAAETKAESAASPKASAAATTEKKETTAAATSATPAKGAAAAAPMNTKGMGPKELENAWEAAIASHNSATLDGLIAADFVGVSSKNKFIGRSQVLSEVKGDKDTYKSAKNDKLNVKMFGPNVAVVTGRAREVGTGKDGKAFDRVFLFTDTWMMRGGKWQCIASQVSKIKG